MNNADVVKFGREWLSDCMWADVDAEDIMEMDEAEILNAICRHYEGGMSAFIRSITL